MSKKLVNDAQRYAALAYNAKVRALQYSGTETGKKAWERSDHWWRKFEATLDKLRELF